MKQNLRSQLSPTLSERTCVASVTCAKEGAKSDCSYKKDAFHIPYKSLTNLSHSEKTAIAVYLKLKSQYINTVFNNYKVSTCSQITDVSPYLLKKYVPILIEKGWARLEKGNLILTAFNKLFKFDKNRVSIKITGSIQDIINEINFSHIEKDYSQQKFMADIGLGRKNELSYRAYMTARKRWEKDSRCQSNTVTSYRRIAARSKISLSAAYRLCDKYIKKGRLQMKTNSTQVGSAPKGFKYAVNEYGYFYSRNGVLIHIQNTLFKIK